MYQIPGTRLAKLAHRSSAGVEVSLFRAEKDHDDKALICARDTREGEYFEIPTEGYLALDVFYHPFAYRDFSTVARDPAAPANGMDDCRGHGPVARARVVLAERKTGGICVGLLWAEDTNSVAVLVHDQDTGDQFELSVEPWINALDAVSPPVRVRSVARRRLRARRHDARRVARKKGRQQPMPLATPDEYREMLDAAHRGRYAYPAVNVSSSETLNAAMRGYAEALSDGIIQVSIGAAEFASGTKNAVLGAQALAAYAHVVADAYPVSIVLHTDHCTADKLDGFVRPLLRESLERRARGELPLYHSHMFDGSELPLDENLRVAVELLADCRAADVLLELEIGVVGGEEDGIGPGVQRNRLYSTPADAVAVAQALGTGERGRYLLAATFGNVHGVWSRKANLRPEILTELRNAVGARFGRVAEFDFVFHGGSGAPPPQVAAAVANGVVKVNIDTDMQYAYTRAVADHVFRNYDGVLKTDGGVGDKKHYDPRIWGEFAEASMANRVAEAARQLGSAGRSSHAARAAQSLNSGGPT